MLDSLCSVAIFNQADGMVEVVFRYLLVLDEDSTVLGPEHTPAYDLETIDLRRDYDVVGANCGSETVTVKSNENVRGSKVCVKDADLEASSVKCSGDVDCNGSLARSSLAGVYND